MKEGWEYIALSSVCRVQNGFAFNSKLFNDSNKGLPLIRIRDIKRGFSLTYTDEACSDDFFVEDGDMLIGMDGDFNIGEWKGGHALLNQRVCKLIPSEKVLAKFIFYFIPEALQRINDKTAFSTVKHLSSKQVNAISLPKLDLSEQQRIVDYLDSAFAKIDAMKANAEKALNEAKALFQASLKEMLEPKEGWEEKTLDDICEIKSILVDPTDAQYKDLLHVGGANIVSETGELIELKTAAEEELTSGKFTFNDKDVLYNKIRPYLIKVSRPDFSGLCSADMYPLTSKKGMTRDYLYYILVSRDFTDYAIMNSARAGMPKLNRQALFAYKCMIPPLCEQQAIVYYLDSLKSKVDKLQANYEKISQECDALKQAILRQVFE
jgi:type I restriction enzyme S subunit